MQDVAEGQEPRQIPLLPGAPAQAHQDLQKSFRYITDWIFPEGVQNSLLVDPDPTTCEDDDLNPGCSCEDAPCNDKNIECTCVIDYGHYYNSEGLLKLNELPRHHTLYECSHLCSCGANGGCANAITQLGVTTNYSVRWTEDRGFGLFAEEDIARGSFLCCYIGEVISTAEAKRRWEHQKHNGHSNYILVLKEETNISVLATIRSEIVQMSQGNKLKFMRAGWNSTYICAPGWRAQIWLACPL